MRRGARRGPRLSIGAKLLLSTLALAVIPWLGYRYVQDLEDYLRAEQERRLLERARLIAAFLGERAPLFEALPGAGPGALRAAGHIYVRPLETPVQVDGYADDWRLYAERALALQPIEAKTGAGPGRGETRARYRLGTHGTDLYALFEVVDDRRVYRHPQRSLEHADHLRIGLLDPQGRFRRYRLATIAPGWVGAWRLPEGPGQSQGPVAEPRIRGEWQETPGGYTVELRIPVAMIGRRLAFAVADVDDPDAGGPVTVLATTDTERAEALGTIVIPDPAVDASLRRFERPGTRVWVLDRAYRVIAVVGELQRLEEPGLEGDAVPEGAERGGGLAPLVYRLVLRQPVTRFEDELSSASRLDTPVVATALAGTASAGRRQSADRRLSIVTAAQPVVAGGGTIGAVAVEETSNSVLILQNRAIEVLVNLGVLAFVLTAAVLLAFAARLSWRVRRLRDQAEGAIGGDGRVRGRIGRWRSGDELGDLARSFSDLLDRLAQYNRYLETMAGKLSHELRTPVTVVRSSLDNLESVELDETARTYVARARQGVERLAGTLARMSEATRLEQTIREERPRRFDLAEVVGGCVEGYRLAHPARRFQLELPPGAAGGVPVSGSPELLAQLLDKLVDNALDFAQPDAAIEIMVRTDGGQALLEVANLGAPLPRDMQQSLFDSMVSLREHRDGQSHLGLGLYVARLIAEFHGGRIEARDREDAPGARLLVRLPRVGPEDRAQG